MKLKTVHAGQGLMWLRAGLAVFFRQPLGFSALFALFGLTIVVLIQIPLAGQLIALALMPWLNVAFLLGTREALAGRTPRPTLLIAPWRHVTLRKRLLQVGIAYALGTLVIVLVAHGLDGGRFVAAVEAIAESQVPPEAIADGTLVGSVLLRMALLAVLSLLFWHVPGLVAWGDMPVPKALFASALACMRSLGALTAFNLAWAAILVLAVVVVQAVLTLLGLGGLAAQALVPVAMLATTAFYASLYFGFVDSFDFDTQGAEADDKPA